MPIPSIWREILSWPVISTSSGCRPTFNSRLISHTTVPMNYLNVIERYNEYRAGVQELVGSILTGIAEPSLLDNPLAQRGAMQSLAENYRFVDLLYTLDARGIQTSDNIANPYWQTAPGEGEGKDRSQRPYFRLARESDQAIVT